VVYKGARYAKDAHTRWRQILEAVHSNSLRRGGERSMEEEPTTPMEEEPTTPEVPESQTVEQRLDQLERENRRLKLAGIVVVVLGGAALLWALSQLVGRTVEARRFILRDSGGEKRAEITVSSEGMAGLWLYDKSGNFRATFTVSPAGAPDIVLFDETGRNRAEFGLLPDSSPGIALSEPGGVASVGILVTQDGLPHFTLTDKTGKVLVKVP
jgi:hypothetical protein